MLENTLTLVTDLNDQSHAESSRLVHSPKLSLLEDYIRLFASLLLTALNWHFVL